jgi:DNA-directed RNA polymerase specialized sigma24 family protein
MKERAELSDQQLMRRASRDQDALAQLVKRYRNRLYAFVYRYVGDRETAEDIVQETFLRAMRHRHKFTAINYVSTWFFTIAVNMAKSELQRRKRWCKEELEPEEGHSSLAMGGPLPDEEKRPIRRWCGSRSCGRSASCRRLSARLFYYAT